MSDRYDLSIVVVGRNDNHNGDFNLRAEYAIRHNAALLEKRGINYEYVWVEWNPAPDRPLFAAAIRAWVRNFRCYVAPPEIHNHLCDNPSVGVMQFHAKNAGIRRAAGEWILSMNADTYLSDETLSNMRLHSPSLRQEAPRLAAEHASLKADTLYLATRVNFPSRLLRPAPERYPIGDIAEREVVRTDEIKLPNAYGSAGDFTLMSREMFYKIGGHYEGIRFANLHIDTLLGLQVKALGGDFSILGRVFHADHADSWNNFAAGDDKKHHNGCNYNWKLVHLPYRNPSDWGLGDWPARPLETDVFQIQPPAGVKLRERLPDRVVVPDELRDLVEFADLFEESFEEARRKSLRIIIYGLGEQTQKLLQKQGPNGARILGYIDDSMKKAPGVPYPLLTWEDAKRTEFDAILIGSFYWADLLYEKALLHAPKEKILPRMSQNKGKTCLPAAELV